MSATYTYNEKLRHSVGLRIASPNEPILRQLLAEYPIEQVIDGAGDDLERVKRARTWVHSRWRHDGWNEPTKSDPLTILREAETGTSFRCVEYTIVLAAALTAIGIPARTLTLMTADTETREYGAAHQVAEAWLPDRAAWVMADGQFDITPLAGDTPLSAIGLQRALATTPNNVEIDTASNYFGRDEYLEWIEPYLVFLSAPLEQRFDGAAKNAERPDLMLVPNELEAPKIFQRKWPIQYVVTTRSSCAFYAPPETLT